MPFVAPESSQLSQSGVTAAVATMALDMDNPHLDPVETFSYLRLISADGHDLRRNFAEHPKDRRIAYECDTFKKMVEKEGFKEGQTNEIQLPTITGKLLEKVIEYLYFKYKYTDAKVPIPEFPIDDDVVLDLLLVAKRTEGFSGRQLAKLVLAYQAAVFGSGATRLTPGLAETVLQYKLAHREESQHCMIRFRMNIPDMSDTSRSY
eukprot:s25_g19.t3